MEQWRLSVFNEAPFLGNQALVYLCDKPVAESDMAHRASEAGAPASCFAWADSRGHQVRCYSPFGAIQCCGHGLLATAHVLHSQHPEGEAIRLYTADQSAPLNVEQRQGRLWLALPRLLSSPVPVPDWVCLAFDAAPTGAAFVGDEQGYLILEYADHVALPERVVHFDQITAHTSRAVIITSAGRSKNYNFLLRYFAPQYGVGEDAVTGSACRVLADYWQQQTGLQEFRAWQCSANGGVITCFVNKHSVEISGHVEVH